MFYIAVGTVVGLTVGCIPGMTSVIGFVILFPFTIFLTPQQSIALLIANYKAANFGGSISAITFGTPGTPAATLDVLDGYTLTKMGKYKKALHIALYSSVTADIGSDLVLLFIVGPLALFALAFGSRELLFLMLLVLTTVILFVRQSAIKGILAIFVGISLAMIGGDPFSGIPRFTFGVGGLYWSIL